MIEPREGFEIDIGVFEPNLDLAEQLGRNDAYWQKIRVHKLNFFWVENLTFNLKLF